MSECLTEQELLEAVIAFDECGTKSAAAKKLGLAISTYKSRLQKAHLQGISIPEKGKQTVDATQKTPDIKVIRALGTRIRTVEQLLEESEVDLNKFEVSKAFVRTWTTSMKLKTKVEDTTVETPYQVDNYLVSVELKRLAPKFVQDAIEGLIESLPTFECSHVVPVKQGGRLLELCLFDAHFGKLAWEQECGDNYDLEIAESVYSNAVFDLTQRVNTNNISKIVIPIGNDFFHANNWKSQTGKGTIVESVDDRMAKVFAAGERAIVNAVISCLRIAPVELVWVPGNHDPETSWYLMRVLKAHFKYEEDVSVDLQVQKHKYLQFGKCLILYTHGESIKKIKSLPLFMATNCPPNLWANTEFREIHTGHLHTEKEYMWETADELHGIKWRVIPSLSATDKWHADNMYTGNKRAAQAFQWDAEEGLTSIDYVMARQ